MRWYIWEEAIVYFLNYDLNSSFMHIQKLEDMTAAHNIFDFLIVNTRKQKSSTSNNKINASGDGSLFD